MRPNGGQPVRSSGSNARDRSPLSSFTLPAGSVVPRNERHEPGRGNAAPVLFFLLYQQVENYILVPRIFRNTVEMPAAAVLLVALIGGTLLGLVGAVMATPIAAAVKVAMSPALAEPGQPDPQPQEG